MSTNPTGLVADVTNGILNYAVSPENTSTYKAKGNELGKDAFLQLLVCQMQNQDPLEPSEPLVGVGKSSGTHARRKIRDLRDHGFERQDHLSRRHY